MNLQYFYAILSGFALIILPTLVSTSIIPATLATVLMVVGAIIVILFSIVLIVKALITLFGSRLK
ncbi:hypothetical protein [Bacillus sp. FJAT-49736]|uniref:hypothetical protein n=1 Tax=Bacillus sp. FJAT-49736 TaxID=2833582 RepID=UPI001BC9640B|nr:hypothetical protein [Bacillus sp. FJAT-49736]MBS4172954.1 hypothetical protein [Bacillus sp. FJAT-49736]